ncbi:MAG: RNA methyltransferase [Desulfurococcaceae archaeon]
MSTRKPMLVIEHCEPDLSPWLILEYRHASLIYGRDHVIFTNVPERYHKLLARYGKVRCESVIALVSNGEMKLEEIIVLDPRAETPLTYQDLATAKYVIVGGILGDHPPRGRTHQYITSRLPHSVKSRNIGNGQYSIDGATYYIDYLWRNKDLARFKYVDGIYIETDQGYVYLPYRYPLVNSRPLIANGLEYYLKYRKMRDDIWKEITSR